MFRSMSMTVWRMCLSYGNLLLSLGYKKPNFNTADFDAPYVKWFLTPFTIKAHFKDDSILKIDEILYGAIKENPRLRTQNSR